MLNGSILREASRYRGPPARSGRRAHRLGAGDRLSLGDWLMGVGGTVYIVSLAAGLVTGRIPVRDERGRPRPAAAALLAVATAVFLGAMLAALLG